MLEHDVAARESVSLETGAIVVLSGEYAPTGPIPVIPVESVDVTPVETVFLSHGEHAPVVEGAWVLVEPFDSWG